MTDALSTVILVLRSLAEREEGGGAGITPDDANDVLAALDGLVAVIGGDPDEGTEVTRSHRRVSIGTQDAAVLARLDDDGSVCHATVSADGVTWQVERADSVRLTCRRGGRPVLDVEVDDRGVRDLLDADVMAAELDLAISDEFTDPAAIDDLGPVHDAEPEPDATATEESGTQPEPTAVQPTVSQPEPVVAQPEPVVARQHEPRADAATPVPRTGAGPWRATHRVGSVPLDVGAVPDGTVVPGTQLYPGLEVRLEEQSPNGWALVECSNAYRCWVPAWGIERIS